MAFDEFIIRPGTEIKLCVDFVKGARQLGWPTNDAFVMVKVSKVYPYEALLESPKGNFIIPLHALESRPDGTFWLAKWYRLPPDELELFYSLICEFCPNLPDTDQPEDTSDKE